MSDSSISNLTLSIENEADYQLTMVRRKVIAGKYFCEPSLISALKL